jgi:hypothetical protein
MLGALGSQRLSSDKGIVGNQVRRYADKDAG